MKGSIIYQKQAKQQSRFALLLLFVLTFSFIPYSSFHHHDDAESACTNDAQHENDPCHISLFHSSDVSKVHCSHKEGHIHKPENHCDICKYLALHHTSAFVKPADVALAPAFLRFKKAVVQQSAITISLSYALFNKGPPVS